MISLMIELMFSLMIMMIELMIMRIMIIPRSKAATMKILEWSTITLSTSPAVGMEDMVWDCYHHHSHQGHRHHRCRHHRHHHCHHRHQQERNQSPSVRMKWYGPELLDLTSEFILMTLMILNMIMTLVMLMMMILLMAWCHYLHSRYEPKATAKGSLCYYKVFSAVFKRGLDIKMPLIIEIFVWINDNLIFVGHLKFGWFSDLFLLQAKEGEDKWREAETFKFDFD